MLKIFAASSLSHSWTKFSMRSLDWSSARIRSNQRRTFSTICSLVTSKRISSCGTIWLKTRFRDTTMQRETIQLRLRICVATLQKISNLFAIVYCNREGAPEFFDDLWLLEVIDIPNLILRAVRLHCPWEIPSPSSVAGSISDHPRSCPPLLSGWQTNLQDSRR